MAAILSRGRWVKMLFKIIRAIKVARSQVTTSWGHTLYWLSRQKLFVNGKLDIFRAPYHVRQDTTGYNTDTHRLTLLNTLRLRQYGRHFADDILKYIFLKENVWISIKISLKFVPKGPINNIPALVQIMAWRRPGDKPLSEPILVSLGLVYWHIYALLGLNELTHWCPNVTCNYLLTKITHTDANCDITLHLCCTCHWHIKNCFMVKISLIWIRCLSDSSVIHLLLCLKAKLLLQT